MPGFETPSAALAALLTALAPVGTETIDGLAAAGRILAAPLVADRDSPPQDVSAMDGYAVRVADLASAEMPVAGEAAIGQPPPVLAPGTALRLFTGAGVPAGAEAVLPREEVHETPERIALRIDSAAVRPGQHIRRRGENLGAGGRVLDAGAALTAPVLAALASFGVARPTVFRKVRLGVLVTGDELLPQRWMASALPVEETRMHVRVKLFGPLAAAAGRAEVAVIVPEPASTCAALRVALAQAEPSLRAVLPACRFAVNHHLAPDSAPLHEGDEVALIGMVAGG